MVEYDPVTKRFTETKRVKMKKQSKRDRFNEAVSKLQEGLSEIEGIKDELENWRDGLSGTNLEGSELYSRLDETVDTLSTAHDDLENVIGELENIEIPSGFRG